MTELETNLQNILNEKQTKILPQNIKEGVQVFDIIGTYRGSGIDTSDATATSNDIVYGKTAYVKGNKITGDVRNMDRFMYVSYQSMENVRHIEEIRIKSINTWGNQLVRVGAYVNNDIPYEQYKKFGPFKMFNSLQEMNSSTDRGNGDVALVYTMSDASIEQTTNFDIIHFNKEANITKAQLEAILNGDDHNDKTFTFRSNSGDSITLNVVVSKTEEEMEEETFIDYMTELNIIVDRNDGYGDELSYGGGVGDLLISSDYYYYMFENELHYNGSNSEWEVFESFLTSIFNKVTMYYTGVYIYDGVSWVSAPNTPDGEERQQALELIAEINGEIV